MIPIRDTISSRTYPVVNMTIIGINVLVFLVQISQGQGFDHFAFLYGLVPARYSNPQMAAYFSPFHQVLSLVSFMFLHGGFWHLLGNMWFLYIFGDNIEDHLGHVRYLAFYLLCGLASGVSHLFLNLHSTMPVIGASGAIAGVMGAYFILYPHSRILTLVPILFLPLFFEIPAFIFLGIWFLFQFLSATGGHAATGIAWWAHIGGFVCGIIFLKLFSAVPATGLNARIRQKTSRKTSHHLQRIQPAVQGETAHLYGDIHITAFEALTGVRKTVNIPWGFQNRLFKVTVPPGVKEGSLLRLSGMGRTLPDGRKGDLLLKVIIQPM